MHEQNWPTLQIFIQCQTQWRVVLGLGGVLYQGLDYSSVAAVLALQPKPHEGEEEEEEEESHPPLSDEVEVEVEVEEIHPFSFSDLRLIEAGALGVLNGDS